MVVYEWTYQYFYFYLNEGIVNTELDIFKKFLF